MNTLFASLSLIVSFALPGLALAAPEAFYDYKVNSIDGTTVPLSNYKGKVLLVVNTASKCGFTPQYEGLQKIYQRYHDRGFEILAFPSNDFGKQEPGTAKEIKSFCDLNYKVKFPLFEKNPVSGTIRQPLYDWLVKHDPKGHEDVAWNFEKFLISKKGEVVARYLSRVTPESVELTSAIEKALK